MKDELKFSVDSQLLGELGEHLVRKNYIALAELIKNSYDADATEIVIEFHNAKGQKPGLREILLSDNGTGMTFDQVRDHWMRIATPVKIREPVSDIFGRPKTGSKGIGRFACRKLAKKLEIVTTAKSSKGLEQTTVSFDWSRFEAGTTLTEIPCQYSTRLTNNQATGTKLLLIDLEEKWTDGEFSVLRREILALSVARGARRKKFKDDPGFSIVFQAPEFEGGTGILVEKFMDAGWGRLTGSVDKNGACCLRLDSKDSRIKDYQMPEKYPDMKGVSLDIAIIPLRKDHFRNPRILSLKVASSILEDYGGVWVFLDGFRIYMYGDQNEDWLGIAKDTAIRTGSVDGMFKDMATSFGLNPARILLNHPRYRNLVGRVFISSSPETRFEVKMDREGFMINDAYEHLRKMIRLSLQWATLHYGKYLVVSESKRLGESIKELRAELRETEGKRASIKSLKRPPISEALDLLSAESKRVSVGLSNTERIRVEKRVDLATRVIQNSITRTEAYSCMLSAAASTGAFFWVFSHEVKGLIGELGTISGTLELISKVVPAENRNQLKDLQLSIKNTRDSLLEQIKLFGVFGKMTSIRERKDLPVKREVDKIVRGFEYLISHYEIEKPSVDIPEELRTRPMLEAELYSIVTNLVSNAVKAVIAGNGSKIRIWARREGEGLILRVSDDGVGIAKEHREQVFEPLVADPEGKVYQGLIKRLNDEDLAALGTGSGLGLAIVRGIVDQYEGTAHFVDPDKGWKTCVEVSLP